MEQGDYMKIGRSVKGMDKDKVIKETEDGIVFAESRGFGGLANTMRDALVLLKE